MLPRDGRSCNVHQEDSLYLTRKYTVNPNTRGIPIRNVIIKLIEFNTLNNITITLKINNIDKIGPFLYNGQISGENIPILTHPRQAPHNPNDMD